MDTYPGTELLKRLCYSCDKLIETLDDLWVDTDSNCCICTECAERGMKHYSSPGEAMMTVRPARTFNPQDINDIEEG